MACGLMQYIVLERTILAGSVSSPHFVAVVDRQAIEPARRAIQQFLLSRLHGIMLGDVVLSIGTIQCHECGFMSLSDALLCDRSCVWRARKATATAIATTA